MAATKTKQIFDTRLKCIIGVLVSLALAYAVGSLAIDSGSLLQYFGTGVLLILAAKLSIRFFRR